MAGAGRDEGHDLAQVSPGGVRQVGELGDLLLAEAVEQALADGPHAAGGGPCSRPAGRRSPGGRVPSLGPMALLRDLRDFDRAGVCDRAAAEVAARDADRPWE